MSSAVIRSCRSMRAAGRRGLSNASEPDSSGLCPVPARAGESPFPALTALFPLLCHPNPLYVAIILFPPKQVPQTPAFPDQELRTMRKEPVGGRGTFEPESAFPAQPS